MNNSIAGALLARSPQVDDPVSSGLNLTLRLKHPWRMPRLLAAIVRRQGMLSEALRELHFVHFARFLPSPDGSSLQVITEFDGPLEHYVLDFAIAIDEIFDRILADVARAPPLPIRDHPDAFVAFVRQHNRVRVCGFALPAALKYPIFSAYPDRTVLDIVGARRDLPAPVSEPPCSEVDRSDVQANILEGYSARVARHLIYQFAEPQQARRWLAGLPVTPATPWQIRPESIVNIGLSWAGLRALGVDAASLERLPTAFREGPGQADRARANGDTGSAAPGHWLVGSPAATSVHAVVSIHAQHADALARAEADVAAQLPATAVIEISRFDAAALTDDKEAFGYRDAIAQPRLALGPGSRLRRQRPDLQPAMAVGALLLGPDYPNEFGGRSLGAMPPELVTNGTFCALRILAQDVAGFEALLDCGARRSGQPREWVAARLMGRWRDGSPLMRHPGPAADDTRACETMIDNAFDYEPSFEHPTIDNDAAGLRCPLDSHVRRANPRSSRGRGVRHSHRLVRRGLPYRRTLSDGSEEQGLFGLFLCASLERQFEFIQQQWLKDDLFAGAPLAPLDEPAPPAAAPAPCPVGGTAQLGDRQAAQRLVTTRGSLYLLMPGLAALRRLGETPAAAPRGLLPGKGLKAIAPSLGSGSRKAAGALQGLQGRLCQGLLGTRTPAALTAIQTAGLKPTALWLPRVPPSVATIPDQRERPRSRAGGPEAASLGSPRSEAASLEPASFDPANLDPWTRHFTSDPYPAMDWLQGHAPVCPLPRLPGYGVFSDAGVRALLLDDGEEGAFGRDENEPRLTRGIFTLNAPRHAIVRGIVLMALHEILPGLPELVERRTRQALEALREPEFDLVEAIALRVPREVLFEVLGVPQPAWPQLDALARSRLLLYGRPSDLSLQVNSWRANVGIGLQMARLMMRARLGKASPLVRALAAQTAFSSLIEPPPDRLTLAEAIVSLGQLVVGGYLPTGYLIGTGTRSLLLDQARHWQALTRQPAALHRAIDEMRRHDSALATVTRIARRDTILEGLPIPAGARVIGFLTAANRDPARFAQSPARFDPERHNADQHLSLGLGLRACPGADLQGQLLPIVFRAMLSALPGLRLVKPDAQPPWVTNPHFRSFTRLDVSV